MAQAGVAAVLGTAPLSAARAQPFTTAAAERSSVVDAVPESTRLALGFGDDPSFVPHAVAIDKKFLRDAGFIETVTRTFSDAALAKEALAAGDLAFWTVGNEAVVTMAHSGTTVVVLGTSAVTTKVAPHSRSLFVTTEAFVRRNPVATRQVVAAMLKAQRYAADPGNREEVIDLFCRQTSQDKALVTARWNDYVFNPAFDQAYVDDMKAITASLAAAGRIGSPKDPLDYTLTDPLAAADATLVQAAGRYKI
jgi:ABC-type nitrate/sulfonate/bicarbonate transport system substrate-binding protein